MRPGSRWAALLVAPLVLVLVAGCSSSAPQQVRASHHPAATAVHVVSPYRSDGTLGTAIAATRDGHCWTTSIAAPSALTYRCLSGNDILDPCFASASVAHPTTVACLTTPWSQATRLRLTTPLPKADAVGGGRVWALRLANGAQCVAATGTVDRVAGHALTDNCAGGYAADIVDTHARRLVAFYGKPGGAGLQRVAVRGVWRA